jgi:hypothetical protein
MTLIDIFESGEQTVKEFNKIFKHTKLVGYPETELVEIGPICSADQRIIQIGEVTTKLCIIQKKSDKKTYYKSPEEDGTKICTKCQKLKHFSEYGPDKKSKYGLNARCKPCVTLVSIEWQRNNREKVRQAQNRRYAEKKGKL